MLAAFHHDLTQCLAQSGPHSQLPSTGLVSSWFRPRWKKSVRTERSLLMAFSSSHPAIILRLQLRVHLRFVFFVSQKRQETLFLAAGVALDPFFGLLVVSSTVVTVLFGDFGFDSVVGVWFCHA